MATRIQLRRDTAANWTAANPVLADGEQALETDTGALKIGDGLTAWNGLSYRDSRYAPASHAGSRDGHPLATTTADGFMAGTDKEKLDLLTERFYVAPDWTAYDITLAANTWTRLNNGTTNQPQISVPALPDPPTGYTWRMRVGGFGRVTTPVAATVYFGVQINNGTMGGVFGGGYIAGAVNDIKALAGAVPPSGSPPVGSAFNVDFSIFGAAAGTYRIVNNPWPFVRIFLVAV